MSEYEKHCICICNDITGQLAHADYCLLLYGHYKSRVKIYIEKIFLYVRTWVKNIGIGLIWFCHRLWWTNKLLTLLEIHPFLKVHDSEGLALMEIKYMRPYFGTKERWSCSSASSRSEGAHSYLRGTARVPHRCAGAALDVTLQYHSTIYATSVLLEWKQSGSAWALQLCRRLQCQI